MGSLITYSGITTKVKAMERWQLREGQFGEMSSLESVPETVQYLKRFPPYREIFEGVEDGELHRGLIEQLLNLSQYRDFAKLYKFANIKQRHFLDLYFMHYEISILKTCLRNAAGRRDQRQDLSLFEAFFKRHSSLDLIALSHSRTMEEFIGSLKGSPYYGSLSAMLQKGRVTLPACETALDMLYFKAMWKIKDKYLPKKEQKILTQCFGTRLDMLNLQWLCRAKKYYALPPGEIYACLIPIQLHLTKKEISKMVEAEGLPQLYSLIERCWYGRLGKLPLDEETDMDQLARVVVDKIYEMTSRKDPYSIAVLNSYLYLKEREIGRIINTIEKIRYGVGAN
ncbi:MAG: V-type ATPase subunit [Clostridium sp.]|nr:V-type ATPase subunit [Clostridium sp.]